MKQEIDGRVYDTTLAVLVASQQRVTPHLHQTRSLYRSEAGDFFLVEERDADGIDGTFLAPLTEDMARDWLARHGRAELAVNLFGDRSLTVSLQLDQALVVRIRAAARASRTSTNQWMASALKAAVDTLPSYAGGATPIRPRQEQDRP